MVFRKFEDILAWQKAQDLAFSIYSVFGKNNDFELIPKDQICRAAISISNNIAEGSCSEVKSMLYLAERLGYISSPQNRITPRKLHNNLEVNARNHQRPKYKIERKGIK